MDLQHILFWRKGIVAIVTNNHKKLGNKKALALKDTFDSE